LKMLCPEMGKARIAQVLARQGLHLGSTTVARMLQETEPVPEDAACPRSVTTQCVTARSPGDLWHVDLTPVPIGVGFWVPWLPFSLPQSWPFCWWVAVLVDQVSRAVVGFAVFPGRPTSEQVQHVIQRAAHRAGTSPRYLVTDKGRQFWCASYKRFCRTQGIRPRFGAVGKQGSIAIVERIIRTMKSECVSHILVSLRADTMRNELGLYVLWYNGHRPSQALGGCTPREVYEGLMPASGNRIEPRPGWPANGGTDRVTGLRLVVGQLEGRKHLPVVELREAA